ncbi:prolyl 3-hydroxylase OGFOD1 [Ambystoma mexicanum]|uniref:prolyl 3-hydroxylase OGFOD1 n=1 Tax=Ambystoma mexicanum TaxID=8296 RepID=UPI0037E871B5
MSGKRQRGRCGSHAPPKRDRVEKAACGPELSPFLRESPFREEAAAAWAGGDSMKTDAFVMDPHPFHHCLIPNFIQSQDFMEGLLKELSNLGFHEKSNDLYKFKQSSDLKKRKEPHISSLRKVLFADFRTWLSELTKVELEQTVDLSCARYQSTDTLLCHDDELEGRRIAFILYLVPPWDKSDGGTLDLFSTDEHFQPVMIEKSLVPVWNLLAFFEVSPVSYHQVSEILSNEKCRLSVSGWFHGTSLQRPPRYIEPRLPRTPHIPHDHEILYEWINPTYLDVESQAHVQEEFEERSEILLKDFLKLDKFQEVCRALEEENLTWMTRGPPNKRCYEQAEDNVPEILKRCLELLRSEAMFLLLSNLTGLKLHFLASSDSDDEDEEALEAGPSMRGKMEDLAGPSSSNPKGEIKNHASQCDLPTPTDEIGEKSSVPVCRGELRHWRNGHYTLIHDTDTDNCEFALDLLLYCGCDDWKAEYGGFTSYIAKDEDEELLTVYPENNSLALVYRDKETLKFVKHINHRSMERLQMNPPRNGFWDFSFVYYE